MEKSVHNKSQCTILPNKENKTKKCALNSETEKWSFLPDSGQNDLVFLVSFVSKRRHIFSEKKHVVQSLH